MDRAGSYPGCVGELCCGPDQELDQTRILDVLVSCVVDQVGSYPGCVGELCCGPGQELSWMCW